jgi:uncharacterized protein (DUF362 family)
MSMLDDHTVALIEEAPRYNANPPYHPSEDLPEWPGRPKQQADNPAYRGVRQVFRALGLDATNFNTSAWNPLGMLIKPGNTVVLKPNFVSHRNIAERYGLTDTDSLITHGSVIRAVMDYAARALSGAGQIIIGDCPIQGTIWSRVAELSGLTVIVDYFHKAFPGIVVTIKDYRLTTARVVRGMVVERVVREDAIHEYYEVDLKERSLLIPLMDGTCEFGVSQYPKHRMRRAHSATTNKYLFPKEIMKADVVINLPKLKTHMKAGVTIALKNLVGINGHKDYLPHFRFGSPRSGGDEYPDLNWLGNLAAWFTHQEWEYDSGVMKLALIYAAGGCGLVYRKLAGLKPLDGCVDSGSWYGNDTLWRTVLDINRAFFYFDCKREAISDELVSARKYMAIVDGLIVGEKESPLAPSPRACGLMLGGFNPVAVDSVGTAMLGFDTRKIPQIYKAFQTRVLPLVRFAEADIAVRGLPGVGSIRDIYRKQVYLKCRPSRGMVGHIEYEGDAVGADSSDVLAASLAEAICNSGD